MKKITKKESERRLSLNEKNIKTHKLPFNVVNYKYNLLLIDTETVGNFGREESVYPFDISYVVYNPITCTSVKLGTILVKEIYDNEEQMRTDFVGHKITKYKNDIEKAKTTQKLSVEEIQQFFTKLINNYNIKIMCAYNAKYDFHKIDKMFSTMCLSNPLKRLNYFDIADMATIVLAKSSGYKRFCKTNNFITKGGKCQVSAEVVGKFIMGINYKEEHTGLEDLKLELGIFNYCRASLEMANAKELLQLNKDFKSNQEKLLQLA